MDDPISLAGEVSLWRGKIGAPICCLDEWNKRNPPALPNSPKTFA